MGSLSNLLNELVEKKAGDGEKQPIKAMAAAAGIDESTVQQILSGQISCPPIERLEGFAEVLDVSVSSLQSAGESDGCDYDGDRTRITVTIDSSQYDEFVKQQTRKAIAGLRMLFSR